LDIYSDIPVSNSLFLIKLAPLHIGGEGEDDEENDWSHLEGMLAPINNACPRCQWFSPTAEDWPAWDGEVPTVRAPTFTVRTGDDPAAIRDAARLAAVAARLAAAAKSESCGERIFAIFFGGEIIPDEVLSYSDICCRLLESGFDDEVGEISNALDRLVHDHERLGMYEGEDGATFYTL
jgi:hypothetical protein